MLEEVSELEGAAEQQVKDLNLGREREACSAGGLLGGPWASTHGPGVPAAPWLEVVFPILPEKTNTYPPKPHHHAASPPIFLDSFNKQGASTLFQASCLELGMHGLNALLALSY